MARQTTPSPSSGNITRDPEMRYTPSGHVEGDLRRRGQPLVAQPADPGVGGADQLLQRRVLAPARRERRARRSRKGTRVVVTGRLEQRSWETEQGEKRSVVEIVADEVGPSLRFATAAGRTATSAGAAATAAAAVAAAAPAVRRRPPATRLRRVRRRAVLSRPTTGSDEEPFSDDDTRPTTAQSKCARPPNDGGRIKKKTSILNTESIEWIDYKDVNLLRRFMSERAKIRARRVTGNAPQQQRRSRGRSARARDGVAAVQRAAGDAAQGAAGATAATGATAASCASDMTSRWRPDADAEAFAVDDADPATAESLGTGLDNGDADDVERRRSSDSTLDADRR